MFSLNIWRRKKTKTIKLDNQENNYRKRYFLGKINRFWSNSKIRIGIDNSGIGPKNYFFYSSKINQIFWKYFNKTWMVFGFGYDQWNQLKIWYFICLSWFDKKEDDGQIMRELPAESEKGKLWKIDNLPSWCYKRKQKRSW